MRSADVNRIGHDPDALERFYREHVEAVQRFVARRVADPQTAADLTAEVFLAAIGAAEGYEPDRGEPSAWLFGIARNVTASERRRVARERDAQARAEGHRLLEPDDVARMQERIDAEARGRELHAAIAVLPDGERAVLELVAVDGLSAAEAAAALGIRPVTARVRLHRARRALAVFVDDTPPLTRPMEART